MGAERRPGDQWQLLKLAKPLVIDYVSNSSTSNGEMERPVVIAASCDTFEVNGGSIYLLSPLDGRSENLHGGIVYVGRQMA